MPPLNLSTSAARAAFRYPNFRSFMPARFLVTASTEMQAIAVAWQIYGITHRPLDLGLVGLAQFLPGILLFLITGNAADRIPRRRILLACCAAFALCSVFLGALSVHFAYLLRNGGLASVWPIYAVLLLNGAVRAFNGPATQAFLPMLVLQKDFPTAVAWSSSIFQTAIVLGPMAGGAVYGVTGSPIPLYGGAAAACLRALVLMSAIRIEPSTRVRPAASLDMVLEGLRYIWRNKVILGAISLDLFAVLLGGAVALLPVYAREILKVGPYGLGFLRSAPGLGGVLMAVVCAHWPLRRRAGASMLFCVSCFRGFTIAFGISRNVVLSMAALVFAGACNMVSVIVRHTLVQLRTPDDMRRRVSAVNMVFIGASNEVGQFESGITAQW